MTNNKEGLPIRETEPAPMFILTWDIIPLVDSLCLEKGWTSPSGDVYESAKTELIGALSFSFGESKITCIDANTVNAQIKRTVSDVKREKSIPVVTMDPIYGANVADYALNTTRGLTADGSIEEIARPGYPAIADQIQALGRSLNGNRKICLVDAGVFSGGSMRTIIESLRKEDITVQTVALGFATKEGERALWNMGIRPLVITDIGDPIDWIEARDFIPFIPLSGRVVKDSVERGKLSTALPYILPEGDACAWASIPPDAVNAVSLAGWNASEIIVRGIQEKNNITLFVSDFIDLSVRVSYPGTTVPGLNAVLDVIGAKKQAVYDIINR